ncbi:DNA endonuclease [Bacillaceae bacterium S4-13-58]
MDDEFLLDYIKKHFPNSKTEDIADFLGIHECTVRRIAKRNNVVKSEKYLNQLKEKLVKDRRKWYEGSIPDFKPSFLQEQLIFGSLLGDGYISKGAARSKNFYYQEHFCKQQLPYRQWKLSKLKNLGFSINGTFLRSPSHPYFTELHPQIYHNGEKILTADFLSKCTHPIFLTSLYLDDGTLGISYHLNKSKKILYCHPTISICTLNLTPMENKLLATHINHTFQTSFVVTNSPYGKGSHLKINREEDVTHFLKIIEKYSKEIPSMLYKTNLEVKLQLLRKKIQNSYGKDISIILSSSERHKPYSSLEVSKIIKMKLSGSTDQEIADELGRTYWSTVYKIGEIRKSGLLT